MKSACAGYLPGTDRRGGRSVHGRPDGLHLWDSSERTRLRRLRGHFAKDGFVHLQHCKIGQNETLLKKLSAILGVPVVAGTSYHNLVYRFNLGHYVKCDATSCKTIGRR
jgi:hypothetical protein